MPAMSVLAALTITAIGSGYHHQNLEPERLLATPSPCNDANGVVWHARPLAKACHYGHLGPAGYGAPPELADELVYVRIDHTVIAISPWEPFTEQGHQKLERARVLWLKENGLVGGVRTHVNAAYAHDRDAHVEHADTGEIKPRAIIHIRERTPADSGELRAQASPKPVFRVLPPTTTGTTELAQAEQPGDAG